MFKLLNALLFSVFLIFLIGCSTNRQSVQHNQWSGLTGAYLGQSPPATEPQIFAPGLVSDGMYNRDIAITPDGNEIYFCVSVGGFRYSTILYSRQDRGIWSEPRVVPYLDNPDYLHFEPCIAPDGQKLFFLSNRPDTAHGETEKGDQDIWVMDRQGTHWGEPYNLGEPVCTDDEEYFPSVTRGGTLYFTRNKKGSRQSYIYRSKLINGKYTEPEKLGPEVNSGTTQFNAFIAADESFIIVPTVGREDSYGGCDYYISFRNQDDTWIGPINMGDKVNTATGAEWSPYISSDGKYFFFMSSRTPEINASLGEKLTYTKIKQLHNQPRNGSPDIYWISAAFIEELRAGEQNR